MAFLWRGPYTPWVVCSWASTSFPRVSCRKLPAQPQLCCCFSNVTSKVHLCTPSGDRGEKALTVDGCPCDMSIVEHCLGESNWMWIKASTKRVVLFPEKKGKRLSTEQCLKVTAQCEGGHLMLTVMGAIVLLHTVCTATRLCGWIHVISDAVPWDIQVRRQHPKSTS